MRQIKLICILGALLALFLSSQNCFFAKAEDGSSSTGSGDGKAEKGTVVKENLPDNESIRIGVKFRPEKCERKSKNGDRINVHYTGRLYTNNQVFDSSVERKCF